MVFFRIWFSSLFFGQRIGQRASLFSQWPTKMKKKLFVAVQFSSRLRTHKRKKWRRRKKKKKKKKKSTATAVGLLSVKQRNKKEDRRANAGEPESAAVCEMFLFVGPDHRQKTTTELTHLMRELRRIETESPQTLMSASNDKASL